MTTQPETCEGYRHSARIRAKLDDLIRDVWRSIDRGHEPAAQALFQKTAEVLSDLKTAYERFEAGAESFRRN